MKSVGSSEIREGINSEVSNERLRTAYREMLKQMRTRYHLTMAFKFGVHETVAVKLLNEFLLYLNRGILKNRFNAAGQSLQGFVVKENTPSMANVHFHIMIADPEDKLPDHDRMDEIIAKKILSANRTVNNLNKISKYHLQDYFEGDEKSSLEQYLTKVFESVGMATDEKINAICPLGEKVSFH